MCEKLQRELVQPYPPVDAMKEGVDAVHARLGRDADADADPAGREGFTVLRAKVETFHRETRTDAARQYRSLRVFATAVESCACRNWQTRELLRGFQAMGKVDAQSYLDEQMARYGFDGKQLRHALARAADCSARSAALLKSVPTLTGPDLAEALRAPAALCDELAANGREYLRGRTSQEPAKRLAAPVNAGFRQTVEHALGRFDDSATNAQAQTAAPVRMWRNPV
jgi:hypothetical protein